MAKQSFPVTSAQKATFDVAICWVKIEPLFLERLFWFKKLLNHHTNVVCALTQLKHLNSTKEHSRSCKNVIFFIREIPFLMVNHFPKRVAQRTIFEAWHKSLFYCIIKDRIYQFFSQWRHVSDVIWLLLEPKDSVVSVLRFVRLGGIFCETMGGGVHRDTETLTLSAAQHPYS